MRFNKIKIGNEWIKHTIKVWEEVKKMLKDRGSIARAMPPVGNVDFPPWILDHVVGEGRLKVSLFLITYLMKHT